MRLGLYGGTFDPIHYGHLLVAETCRESAMLDEVWFIPAATSPLKAARESASAEHRAAMLKLAVGGHAQFKVNTIELDRGGLSYTVDTLREIQQERADDELFFLMGGDSLADFPKWRAPGEICRLATPLVIQRPGAPAPDFEPLSEWIEPTLLESIQRQQVTMPQIDLSSTEIRRRIGREMSIRFRLPRAVEKYIEAQKLYR